MVYLSSYYCVVRVNSSLSTWVPLRNYQKLIKCQFNNKFTPKTELIVLLFYFFVLKVMENLASTSQEGTMRVPFNNESSGGTSKCTLPMVNVKEKIIIVLDRAEEDICTPFKLPNFEQIHPLAMLKRGIELFLHNKQRINKKHEYAFLVLNEDSVSWLVDFTNNINNIIKALGYVDACKTTEDIFNLNLLFDIISQHIQVPELYKEENVVMPPNYVVRIILFYGRSYTIPQIEQTPEIKEFLKAPYLTLDMVMTHESIDGDNKCHQIATVLQNLDQKGFSYFFSVERDMKTLFNSMGRLLGHPLQRPIQKGGIYAMK